MMRKNGQRSKSSKRKPRNSTSKKQRQQKEHLNNDVAGADVKMEAIKELATGSQPGKPKHGTSQPKPSSSSSATLNSALSLKQLLENLSDADTENDSDSDSIAEFRENNHQEKWMKIAETGLKDELKEDIMKKYAIPDSLPMLRAPILNPEIAELLSEEAINFDNQIVERQNQLGVAVTAIMQAMKGILTKKMKRSEIIKIVNDAGMLLADSQFTCTEQQREGQRLLAMLNPLGDRSNITEE